MRRSHTDPTPVREGSDDVIPACLTPGLTGFEWLAVPADIHQSVPASVAAMQTVSRGRRAIQCRLRQDGALPALFIKAALGGGQGLSSARLDEWQTLAQSVSSWALPVAVFDVTSRELVPSQLRRDLVALSERGMLCAMERVHPLITAYVGDLLASSFVPASSTESVHDMLASSAMGLPMAIETDRLGRLSDVLSVLDASRRPGACWRVGANGHAASLRTQGNGDVFVVLRGDWPNEQTLRYRILYAHHAISRLIPNSRTVLVDCSTTSEPVAWLAATNRLFEQGYPLIGAMVNARGDDRWAHVRQLAVRH